MFPRLVLLLTWCEVFQHFASFLNCKSIFPQATLGESQKKGDGSVPIYVKYGDKKLVLGTLSADKFPQVSFDLVFEKEFELSHNWNGGSVYFMGYKMAASEEYPFQTFHLLFQLHLKIHFAFIFVLSCDSNSLNITGLFSY